MLMKEVVRPSPLIQESFSEIVDSYEVFILDMWGVLYNGSGLYEGVSDCLAELKKAGKQIALLSNAPRKSQCIKQNLSDAGLDESHYNHVVTSGDMTHAFLKSEERLENFAGNKCYFIGAERHLVLLEGTDIEVVSKAEEADFILLTGPRTFEEHLKDFHLELNECAKYELPMICANPDKFVMVDGKKMVCAGLLAQYYQMLKQRVQYFGKPFGMVYKAVHEFYPDVPHDDILVVGDAFETDIKGGTQSGYDSALIAGGIHLDELGGEWGKTPSLDDIEVLCSQYGLWPHYVFPALRW